MLPSRAFLSDNGKDYPGHHSLHSSRMTPIRSRWQEVICYIVTSYIILRRALLWAGFPWKPSSCWALPWIEKSKNQIIHTYKVVTYVFFYIPVKFFKIDSLKLFTRLSVENGYRRGSWDFFKNGSLVFWLKVPVYEVLHIGELKKRIMGWFLGFSLVHLVQTSSGAWLDDALVDGVVLPLLAILALHLVLLRPHHEQEAAQQRQAQQLGLHHKLKSLLWKQCDIRNETFKALKQFWYQYCNTVENFKIISLLLALAL